MSDYPPDDFDQLDDADQAPAGAHRARPNLALAVVPLLLVALAVVAVVVGAIMVARSGDPATGTTTPTSPATAAGVEPTGDGGTAPPATGEPTTSEPATSEPAPTEPPDRSVAVTVLNGTRRGGVAGDVAARLEDAGWEQVSTGNYREGGTPPTTVFYDDPDDLATAGLAAADLGGLPVAQDGGVADGGVVVLLGEDFAG